MSDSGKLLGTRDAGKRVGVSGQTVKNLVRQGQLPALHTSIGYVLKERDIDKLAKQRTQRQQERKAQ